MGAREIRQGVYGIYGGKAYKILPSGSPDTARLLSSDKDDLKNGFENNYSEYTSKKYGFTCAKNVPLGEVSDICFITPKIIYKGLEVFHIGSRNGTNFVTLCGKLIRSCNPGEEERKYEDELIKREFHKGIVDKTFYMYIKEVPIDDPELELFELRQKLN
ncbi:MAG: hypothetical protein K2N72_06075 [Oscillospiraceae bacterium]|nr:hypothetical protein [Oscillospiraceae bacterium]